MYVKKFEEYTEKVEITHTELANIVAEKLGYEKAEYLAQGSNGAVYVLNDRLLLKLTNDKKEAETAAYLNLGKYLHLCNIQFVAKLSSDTHKLVSSIFRFPYINELYVIIVEKASDTDKATEIVTKIYDFFNKKVKDMVFAKKVPSLVLKYYNKFFKEGDEELKPYYSQLVNIILELKNNGIQSTDMHVDNFGFIEDKLVLFDILSSKKGKIKTLTL